MFTLEEANKLMQNYVDYQNRTIELNNNFFPNIVIKKVEDYNFCWVFYWQVKEVAKDYRNVIIGNSPVLILKDSLEMFLLGTGQIISEQIEGFHEYKDLFLQIEDDKWGNFNTINR